MIGTAFEDDVLATGFGKSLVSQSVLPFLVGPWSLRRHDASSSMIPLSQVHTWPSLLCVESGTPT